MNKFDWKGNLVNDLNRPVLRFSFDRHSLFGRFALSWICGLLCFLISAAVTAGVVFLAAIGGLPTGGYRGASTQTLAAGPEHLSAVAVFATPIALFVGLMALAGWYCWRTACEERYRKSRVQKSTQQDR